MKQYFKLFIFGTILIMFITLDIYPKKTKSYTHIKMNVLLKKLDLFSPRMILRNEAELKLTSEQTGIIESILLKHEKHMIKTGAQIKINELELVYQLSEEPV